MTYQASSRSSHCRIFAAFAAVSLVLLLLWNTKAYVAETKAVVPNMTDSLKVAVRQKEPASPELVLSATNTGSKPMTMLTWNTPLDAMALQLGLLELTPEGSDSPLDLTTIQVRRRMPPGEQFYVTIEPGKTEEREIVLRKPVVDVETLKGKLKVVCKGEWNAVWPVKKEDMTDDAMKNAWSEDAMKGAFESDPVAIEL